MILAVDIGNTNVVFGGFEGDELVFTARVSTDPCGTEDEYAVKLRSALAIHRVDHLPVTGAIVSSVVPTLNRVIDGALKTLFDVTPITVGPGVKTGINIRCDTPSSVGSDIICACVAAQQIYGAPALVVDFGTATKLMVVNESGSFIGVSICPGVMMGLNALAEQTAQLPKVSPEAPPLTVAKNTADSVKSGVIFGHAAMIDGMIDRICAEVGALPVYATGGMASLILPHCVHPITQDEHLVLKGLNLLYRKNS